MSIRKAARVFGVDRPTVAKMLAYTVPPGYRWGKPYVKHPAWLSTPSHPPLPVLDKNKKKNLNASQIRATRKDTDAAPHHFSKPRKDP